MMLKNYFKTAIRNLIKNKTFSFINIIGLAVSMAVCLLIINIIAEQKSYDTFHTKKDRIYRVMTTGVGANDMKTATSAFPLAKKLKQEYPGIEQSATLVRNIGGDMLYKENAASGGGYFADGELFKILDFKLSKGDAATALQNPFSLVITDDIAKLLFGKEDAIGKVVQFNDKGINPGGPEKGNRETSFGSFTITGVLQAVPGKTHLPFKLLASLSTLPVLAADKKIEINVNDWNNVWTNYTYVLLDKTKTSADLNNMLSQISSKQYIKGSPNEYQFQAKALTAITPANPIGNETHIAMPYILLLIISILGLIVMLSACLNYTNLSVARSLSRTKEVGIRKVSGATRTQVFLQFIVEAIVVSLLSLALAILLLFFLKKAFTGLWFNQFMNISLQQNIWLYVIFVAFSIVIGLIAGLLPSVYISAFNPLVMMRNFGGVKFFKRLTIRKALLVVQFSVSLIFIISTVVLYQQTNHVLNFDYGFNKENIINVNLYKQENYQRFVQSISSNKNIAAVSGCSFLPSTGTQNGTLVYKAENRKDSLQISFMDVDSKFIDLLSLQLTAGKTFPDVVDTSGENYVVVNETFVKDFKYTSAAGVIGQRISIEGNTVEVIGVVKDFQFLNVTQKMMPLVLRNRPAAFGVASIKVRGTDMASAISFLQATWKKVNPNTKFEYQFYDEQLLFTHSMLSDVAKILGALSLLAVLISCLGLLGMAAYTAETRAKEISIRKIVGSSVPQIIVLLTKGFVIMLGIAAVIAIPIAYLLNNMWLQFFASRVSISPLTLIISVLVMFIISLLTVFSQSWRAAFANPINKLRSE
jgi:putative ABC transport system permease protein